MNKKGLYVRFYMMYLTLVCCLLFAANSFGCSECQDKDCYGNPCKMTFKKRRATRQEMAEALTCAINKNAAVNKQYEEEASLGAAGGAPVPGSITFSDTSNSSDKHLYSATLILNLVNYEDGNVEQYMDCFASVLEADSENPFTLFLIGESFLDAFRDKRILSMDGTIGMPTFKQYLSYRAQKITPLEVISGQAHHDFLKKIPDTMTGSGLAPPEKKHEISTDLPNIRDLTIHECMQVEWYTNEFIPDREKIRAITSETSDDFTPEKIYQGLMILKMKEVFDSDILSLCDDEYRAMIFSVHDQYLILSLRRNSNFIRCAFYYTNSRDQAGVPRYFANNHGQMENGSPVYCRHLLSDDIFKIIVGNFQALFDINTQHRLIFRAYRFIETPT